MINEEKLRMYREYERERKSLNQHPYNCKLIRTLPNGTQDFKLGFWFFKCTIVLSKEMGLWHLSVSGRNRKPSPRQLFVAQAELLPLEVKMLERKGIGIDPFCVHLFQLSGTMRDAIDWLEERGYQRDYVFGNSKNDGWRKGELLIPYSSLPNDSMETVKLRNFKAYVITQETSVQK
ncbi:hypothetical protein [Paenibacillus periandrae]|uniref:hypothetical protein n=1 Tax=Paenibacillus periandrae TaxID=1761741 RepID=UPI001F09A233|nr:hypothetical protein [Paenibacillus periandrae]